ncbi:hypothetical protein [Nocardia sp. NPDC060249]|uniref:hypothetical protein n=1 Tax=Nocardia sp. NPDC060249 TaxID=3347082 RepID=UPI003665F562
MRSQRDAGRVGRVRSKRVGHKQDAGRAGCPGPRKPDAGRAEGPVPRKQVDRTRGAGRVRSTQVGRKRVVGPVLSRVVGRTRDTDRAVPPGLSRPVDPVSRAEMPGLGSRAGPAL